MLAFITKLRNLVEAILAQFPKSSIALAVVAAALLSRLGFHVTAAQVGAIVSAVVVIIGALSHYSGKSVSLRKVEAGK